MLTIKLTEAEAAQLGLPSSSATFDVLFDAMNQDLKRNRTYVPNFGSAPDMSEDETRISFLNRYFVFKKVRNVNLEQMAKRHGHDSSQSILAKETEAKVELEEESELVIQVKRPSKLPKQRIKIVSKSETEQEAKP